jgi:hypothetical protein
MQAAAAATQRRQTPPATVQTGSKLTIVTSLNLAMGNAITNPGRFIEKKILHEQFGVKDPKFPEHHAVQPSSCEGDWQARRDAEMRADAVVRGVGQAVGAGGSDLSAAASMARIASSYGHCK